MGALVKKVKLTVCLDDVTCVDQVLGTLVREGLRITGMMNFGRR